MTRVLLADDHPVVRTGIRTLLQQAEDIVVVAETGDGREVFKLVDALTPDVLLLELWRKLGDDEVRKAAYRGRCLKPA